MPSAEKTILVICAYNEEKNIGYILGQAAMLKSAGTIDDFVVVDDGSKDGTSGVARAAGATVIRLNENVGKGGAFAQGALYCKNHGATTLLMADADTFSGFTQAQVIYMLDALQIPIKGQKTMMAVSPSIEKCYDENGLETKGVSWRSYSGYRAIRTEGLNFLFVKRENGWSFAESYPAKRFFDWSGGFALEATLNELFRKRRRFLEKHEEGITALSFGRNNTEAQEKQNDQVERTFRLIHARKYRLEASKGIRKQQNYARLQMQTLPILKKVA